MPTGETGGHKRFFQSKVQFRYEANFAAAAHFEKDGLVNHEINGARMS